MQEEFNINRVVPLMLKVSDIQLYDDSEKIFPYDKIVSNSVGSISKCLSQVSWNVNMETVLGDLYNQYEYFNLELVQFMTTPVTGGGGVTFKAFDNGSTTENRQLSVFIDGLQFVRSTFNQKTGCESNQAHLCNISVQYDINNAIKTNNWRGDEYLYHSQKGYSNYNLCFRKEKQVTITLKLGALETGLDYIPSDIFDGDPFLTIQYVGHHFIAKFNIIPFK